MKIKKDTIQEISKLSDEGLSVRKISKKLNISPSSVYYYIQKAKKEKDIVIILSQMREDIEEIKKAIGIETIDIKKKKPEDYLTIEEASNIFNINKRTLAWYLQTGKLKGVGGGKGKSWLIPITEIEKIKNLRKGTPSDTLSESKLKGDENEKRDL
ncbi:MAG TPA: helix-turn-helix domain-containing protein [Caldisericia bacterium]|jgi:predicted transcriptional regulator|nr:helix-turn-helix domain-containing protein [Caldisericia bacterium]HRT03746.1 helix-turn-helix domain-containing protein [Candidatus Diapherotrites archaeon]HON83501.1 helix-turn-helix domain-containing protein [Caldisericia bacterium]HPB34171.1 helix-turn-helix domain-containing protein [Caldisericia bacterium]HQL67423.1 helix-turn-helix domain-containing protein [Caldisericia bacterium]